MPEINHRFQPHLAPESTGEMEHRHGLGGTRTRSRKVQSCHLVDQWTDSLRLTSSCSKQTNRLMNSALKLGASHSISDGGQKP